MNNIVRVLQTKANLLVIHIKDCVVKLHEDIAESPALVIGFRVENRDEALVGIAVHVLAAGQKFVNVKIDNHPFSAYVQLECHCLY